MRTINNIKIELNEQFRHALNLIEETDRNVFITGRAGTGKSTLLQYFRDSTKKNIAVLAPTGVAAVNIKGQTIHSFFNFRPDVTIERVNKIRPRNKTIYKNLDAVIMDEISMVRADLLDCVDIFLRLHGRKKAVPFGGIQMVFIGDLYQLPPVVTSREKELFEGHYRSPYFFDARVFDEDLFSKAGTGTKQFEMEFMELEKVYRQQDEHFLGILNSIRNNSATDEDMDSINKRYQPEFRAVSDDFYICLTTTNNLAEGINSEKLSEIRGGEFRHQGSIEGEFDLKNLPTALDLALKEGAQVMLLNNDSLGRWINGSIGRVADIQEEEDAQAIIWVELPDGEVVDVVPYSWEMYEFSYDKDGGKVISRSVGSFAQYPLKLAWAVTIHKSQGMTFDNVIIDIGRGTFSHGQLYVALSRCTSLNGIVLKRPVHKKHILMDRRIVEFVTKYQYRQAEGRQSVEERLSIIQQAIKEKRKVEIVYLKTKDEKSKRVILPSFAGELEYNGRKFPGVEAFCTNRKDDRVFHMERILEMRIVK
jgi:ATP-dependent exoDNAse (exonuclease V) alpha subunit